MVNLGPHIRKALQYSRMPYGSLELEKSLSFWTDWKSRAHVYSRSVWDGSMLPHGTEWTRTQGYTRALQCERTLVSCSWHGPRKVYRMSKLSSTKKVAPRDFELGPRLVWCGPASWRHQRWENCVSRNKCYTSTRLDVLVIIKTSWGFLWLSTLVDKAILFLS